MKTPALRSPRWRCTARSKSAAQAYSKSERRRDLADGRYWRLPDATAREFHDDWFRTGDVGIWSSSQPGQLKIIGRKSADIIKSGGEKISAVEIERCIMDLEGVTDVAVVGVEDEAWGQVVSLE